MMGTVYQGWPVPDGSLEAPQLRALMQLLVGVEQGHIGVPAYAAAVRRLLVTNPPLIIAKEVADD